MKTQPSVAVVGAGMSGLTCATALKGLIDRVTVFDRNVFPGGRVSRFRAGDLEFNHGAQYFTVSNPLFWNIVSAWQTDGIVRRLSNQLSQWQCSSTPLGVDVFPFKLKCSVE